MTTDLLIIGGGPAGYEAALEAARRGVKTALMEKEHLGGTCLNWGCIPTKFFLGAVAATAELEGQKKMKIASGQVLVDLPALVDRKARHLEATRKVLAQELEKAGVELVRGELKMMGASQVVYTQNDEPKTLKFDKCMLATGSRPAAYPGLKADHSVFLNSGDILSLKTAPESLAVVGCGAIGLEMAQFFSRLGSKITLLEAKERIAPTEDEEVSKVLAQVAKRQGWAIHTGVKIAGLSSDDGRAHLHMEDGSEVVAEKALLAMGRHSNALNLMLEILGAEHYGPGWVCTDKHLMATPTIYAIGDVNGRTLLAHAAEDQARYAVRHFLGDERRGYKPGPIAACMYGSPETMRVGLLEADAKAQDRDVTVTRAQLVANPIAQAHAATAGLVKCVWREGKLVGVTAVGHGVAQLAALATVMVSQRWTAKEAAELIFPHPTLEESFKAALLA
ncbi:FAD-dependent oxidoreductase [Fundidesulfovibrio butyratiphilus]